MTKDVESLGVAVGALLAHEQNPTPERIRELISSFREVGLFNVNDEVAEKLAWDFEETHGVTMTLGSVLVEEGYRPWLDQARSSINPYYWERYKQLLIGKGFSGQVIATLDNITDRILGLLENPMKTGSWDRKGMVVGYVQSGKTANYIGLINKAADAGYKLIIVIAGVHNNLRNQTQIRVDEGFVGFNSARLLSMCEHSKVGVGRFDCRRRPVTFTNSKRDFNKVMATGVGVPLNNLTEPAVFVIKKNMTTLHNLIEWLKEHNARHGADKISSPMLLIDDESDNASINVKYGKDGVSRINGQIRSLLNLSERSCYVGYTATPFANIFIDPDSDDEMIGEDLFPRNFIVSLDPPSNYFSPNRVFIDDPQNIIRHIDDNEDILPIKHKIDTEIVELPGSLVKAVRAFIVARAIRLVRGHVDKHCSMLVNASRFTNVQKQLRNLIHQKLDAIRSSIRIYATLPSDKALKYHELAALYSVWEEEYSQAGSEWLEIQKKLLESVAPISVVEVNSRSSGALNYSEYEESGLNVIAVGGFSLSRGLTLEGLIVSYFLRNSIMYDTLMQMGRWFGYRPGYDDLCRVWMPEEAEGWYSHVTESIEMLRDELRSMEAAGASPADFGLKVRRHPETLIVTARNKMGTGERVVVKIGLGNSFVETAILKRDSESLETNRRAVLNLSSELTNIGMPLSGCQWVKGGWLMKGVPVKAVLEFLSRFDNHPGSMLTETGPVRSFIKERSDDELAKWDIFFPSLTRPDETVVVDDSLGIRINCQRRTVGKKRDSKTFRIGNKQKISTTGIEKIGLGEAEILSAELDHQRNGKIRSDQRKSNACPDHIYRKYRKRPLLIVHLLTVTEDGRKFVKDPVVAWSISFPKTQREEERVEYVVNTTWIRENYQDDLDEDEMGGDDADE